MNDNERFFDISLSSNACYKDITTLYFTPLRKLEMKKVRTKGEKRYWKWLGILPLFTLKNKEDLYVCRDLFWDYELRTFEQIAHHAKDSIYYSLKGGDVFANAKVIEKHLNGKDKEYYFSTNEEAMNKLNEIKQFCKECGNELR